MFLPKKGSDIEAVVELPCIVERTLTHVEMAMQLKSMLDKWSSDEMNLIKEWYPEGVVESDLPSVAQRLKSLPKLSLVEGFGG